MASGAAFFSFFFTSKLFRGSLCRACNNSMFISYSYYDRWQLDDEKNQETEEQVAELNFICEIKSPLVLSKYNWKNEVAKDDSFGDSFDDSFDFFILPELELDA